MSAVAKRVTPQLAFAIALIAAPLSAQEAEPAQDSVLVAADENSGNNGRIAINIAAGTENQQVGAAGIAIGDVALGTQSVLQVMDRNAMTERATRIAIGPGAFSDNTGMVSLNVTAGTKNQSANLALLAIGNRGALTDQTLAQASASTRPPGASDPGLQSPNDAIDIDGDAFGNNSGLVQMNLIGGEGNSSANTFALSVSGEGQP